MQRSHSFLLLLLMVSIAGIVLSSPSTARRRRVRRQNMKVRINATGDTIVMKFLRPSADTKLEGYILGYGSSMFSKQYIQLPENGQPYETEIDAEPKYLIAVQPIPANDVKKQCTGKVELQKPLHLVIGSVTPTSVLLSWGTLLKTPYEGNIMNDCLEDGHYTVRYREKSRKWNYQTCPTSDTVIDNLKPNTAYEFGVQPTSKEGSGGWSKPVVHNTNMGEKPIQKPFKPRPVKPVKPFMSPPHSFPFPPRHVLNNRTQGRLPLFRNVAPKTTLASKLLPPLPIPTTVASVTVSQTDRHRHAGHALPHPQPQPKLQPKTQPQTQPQPQPKTQPQHQPQPQPHPKTWPQSQPQPQPKPQPQPQPQPQPKTQPHPQQQTQPKFHPQPQPHPQHQPTTQPQPHPQHQPTTQPQPQPQPQPKTQPQPQPQPQPKTRPQPQPQPETQPHAQPQPQPQPEIQPQAQPQSHPQPETQPQAQPHPKTQPQSQSQPQPQPNTQLQPQPQSQPQPTQPQPKTQPHPKPQPQPRPKTQPQPKPRPHPKPKTQLKPKPHQQPQSKTQPQPKPQPQPQPQSKTQPKPQPQPQPKTQPKPQPQPQPKTQPKPQPQPQPKTQPKPQPQPQPNTQPKPQPQPLPKTKPQLIRQPHPQTRSQPQSQPKTKPLSQPQPLPQPHLLPRPQPQPGPQPQTRTHSPPTRVTPRQPVPTAPSPPEEGKPLPRPALATEKASSNNQGTGIQRSSTAAVPRSTISSSVTPTARNTTQSRTRVSPYSTPNGLRPFSPPRASNSSLSSITPGADGEYHKGHALPKPVVWSKDKTGSTAILRPSLPVNKRPNLVGKPGDHDKPMDLKQGEKESILKPFLVTAKPKHERKQTTTSAPALNSSRFDMYENSSIFSSLPASDVDALGNKRFVAPHVIYKTDKKPDEPCSITTSLAYFPEEEASEQNVTGPPRVPPSNLTVMTVEGCSSFVILDWEKSDNDTKEYEVVSKTEGPNGEEVSILTTNQTHTAVENLKPESSYEFKVTPKNVFGPGPSSERVSFSTESADPRVSENVSGKDAIWTQFPFKADAYSECNGKQYVKRTWYRKFVGIQLCNSLRYKIYLSDSLNGKFHNIGDQTGHGEDHCQFVDSFLDGRTGTQLLADQLPGRAGFYRAMRQEPVNFGEIGGKSHVTYVGWYECGVPIPGKW
ncbi:target of Nesh-SH3-like [Centroberyx affinis]|uniref:target of Nesh-SH3-like n=1 Tax=Centroberyx affinis TaxID=166261 RepID=UPI003A5BA683